MPGRPGEFYFAFGGDFEPEGVYHDDNFLMNGLVSADRVPHPGLIETKKVYQHGASARSISRHGEIEVTNGYFFVDLDHLEGVWKVAGDGETVASGSFQIEGIGPAESRCDFDPDA